MVRLGFRLNNNKQSASNTAGEFLRTQFTKEYARGYVARAISSLVSGNWITETHLTLHETLHTFRRAAHTISQRSCTTGVELLLTTQFAMRCSKEAVKLAPHIAHDLLSPYNGVDHSPAMRGYDSKKLYRCSTQHNTSKKTLFLARFATQDYISSHVNSRVFETLGLTPGEVVKPMQQVSAGSSNAASWCGDVTYTPYKRYQTLLIDSLLRQPKRESPHDVWPMNLMPSRFNNTVATAAAIMMGYSPTTTTVGHKFPITCDFGIPYTDAEMCNDRISTSIHVYTDYPVLL